MALTRDEVGSRARRVRLLACDVDGVLTDGKLHFQSDGERIVEAKSFSILDGFGIRLLREAGIAVALITGRRSPIVDHRAREMGVAHVVQGVDDKLSAWTALRGTLGLAAEDSAYIGDDWPDLAVIRACGLGITVPGAPEPLLHHADYITRAHGGEGAVREVCELILAAQGALEPSLEAWLR